MSGLYFYVSKIFWFCVAPFNLFLFILIVAVILLRTRFINLAQSLLTFLGILAVLFILLPIDFWLMLPLENAYSAPKMEDLENIDGVIVLGGEAHDALSTEHDMPLTPFGAERLNQFIALYLKNPNAKFVFTGGAPNLENEKKTEAYFSKLYMKKLGMDVSKVIFEDKSRNTHENVVMSKNLISPQPNEKWVLITSAYHMRRAKSYFQKQSWDVIPFPVGYRHFEGKSFIKFDLIYKFQVLNLAVKEWVGILAASIF